MAEPKLKPEVKEKWLAALRSGNYKQTQNRLKRNDTFCCLGVLCDISGQGEWVFNNPGDQPLYMFSVLDSSVTGLPVGIIKWAFDSYEYNSEVDKVIIMNDRGVSFKKIADHIEANF